MFFFRVFLLAAGLNWLRQRRRAARKAPMGNRAIGNRTFLMPRILFMPRVNFHPQASIRPRVSVGNPLLSRLPRIANR